MYFRSFFGVRWDTLSWDSACLPLADYPRPRGGLSSYSFSRPQMHRDSWKMTFFQQCVGGVDFSQFLTSSVEVPLVSMGYRRPVPHLKTGPPTPACTLTFWRIVLNGENTSSGAWNARWDFVVRKVIRCLSISYVLNSSCFGAFSLGPRRVLGSIGIKSRWKPQQHFRRRGAASKIYFYPYLSFYGNRAKLWTSQIEIRLLEVHSKQKLRRQLKSMIWLPEKRPSSEGRYVVSVEREGSCSATFQSLLGITRKWEIAERCSLTCEVTSDKNEQHDEMEVAIMCRDVQKVSPSMSDPASWLPLTAGASSRHENCGKFFRPYHL